MKTSFENLPIIKFCISRPLHTLFIAAVCFSSTIAIDQYAFRDKSLSNKTNVEQKSLSLSEVSPKYDITYVAWATMQPGMFRFVDTKVDGNKNEDKNYLASLKSTSEGMVNCFQLQMRFAKRIIQFTNNED